MIKALLLSAVALLTVSAAHAAESWNLPGEEPASFTAKVVDVQCALTGDCPRDCGAGRRQLGLLTAENRLVLAMKSVTPFAGAVRDLLPYCGQTITVDGLFATNEGSRVFALQRLKPPRGQWISAGRFLTDWAKANKVATDGDKAAEWFRHDPTVAKLIATDGKLGLGPGILPKE